MADPTLSDILLERFKRLDQPSELSDRLGLTRDMLERNPGDPRLQQKYLEEAAAQRYEPPSGFGATHTGLFLKRVPEAIAGLRAGPIPMQRPLAIFSESRGAGSPAIMEGVPAGATSAAVRLPNLPRERHWSGVTRSRVDNDNPAVGGNLSPFSGPGFNVSGGYGSLQAALDSPHGPALRARLRSDIADSRREGFEIVPGQDRSQEGVKFIPDETMPSTPRTDAERYAQAVRDRQWAEEVRKAREHLKRTHPEVLLGRPYSERPLTLIPGGKSPKTDEPTQ